MRHDRSSVKGARRGFVASAFAPDARRYGLRSLPAQATTASASVQDGLDGYLTALIIGPRFIDPRQWIALFVGERGLMALEGTTEALAVQTLVANYNRISTGLAETPETWRPRFARRKDGTFDAFEWSTAFLLGTGFAPRLWRPVLHGRPETGDVIAPIRDTTHPDSRLGDEGITAIARAAVAIRSYFMPRRVKAARR